MSWFFVIIIVKNFARWQIIAYLPTTQYVTKIAYLHTMHELQRHSFTVSNIVMCVSISDILDCIHLHYKFLLNNSYRRNKTLTKLNVSLLAEKKTFKKLLYVFFKILQISMTFNKKLRYSHGLDKVILHSSFAPACFTSSLTSLLDF